MKHAAQTHDCQPGTTSMLIGELQITTYTWWFSNNKKWRVCTSSGHKL